MKLSNGWFTIVTATSVVAICATLAAWKNGWFKTTKKLTSESPPDVREIGPPHPGWIQIGEVWRPPTDVTKGRHADLVRNERKGHDWGHSQPVDPRINANTRSLLAARGNQELAYRFSSMQPAPPFDRAAFKENPQAYLDEVAPGRINQVLLPSPNVVPIKRQGQFHHTLIQGESVLLQAEVAAEMPVTFQSTKLGHFQNQLATITVRADGDGIAKATFTASGGTRGEIDIRAASPVHSDHARWVIDVVIPNKATGPRISQTK